MFEKKSCSNCVFICDLINELDDEGNEIILCCECRAKNNLLTILSIWLLWCRTCSNTAARELDYRIDELRKQEKMNKY
ncbi:MAG: hypothetical protein HZR80_15145 [Candidatus Heimdallarchaeota archaeon]